jgi:uncharacterized membrane protein YheB (UPF0754 family)
VVEATLAIYEALIQANVPTSAARRVAESLEKDMSSNLATKQDVQHLAQLMATRFEAFEGQMAARFEAYEGKTAARLEASEGKTTTRLEAVEARLVAMEDKTVIRFRAVDDRFSELESRIGLMMRSLESRMVIKLGALMTVLIGATGGVLALLR